MNAMSTNDAETWHGPAFLSCGFRPFFLLAALYAAIAIGIWIPWFFGIAAPKSTLPPLAWHAHALLFEYMWAVIAGFLLTAVSNWTGRTPIRGWPLLTLVLLWVGGRATTHLGQALSPLARAACDLAMPVALVAAVAREIIAAENWRNAKVLAILVVLGIAQGWFHYEIERYGVADTSQRLAIAALLTLITLIGGRIIPAFTTNWLKPRAEGRLPAAFARFDVAVMGVNVAALGAWVARAEGLSSSRVAGGVLLLAGALHIVRQARWAPERTLREPLVAILHVGYAFVGLGFILAGASEWSAAAVPPSASMHAWATGAIGTMTLAVMTRASLRVTGRMLTAGALTTAIYVAIVSAAIARVAAALMPQHTLLLVPIAGLLWIAAFLTFVFGYGASLLQRQVHG